MSYNAHLVRSTSLNAWMSLEDLGEKQQEVYNCIKDNSQKGFHLTDYEIAHELGYANPNVVRPRRNELAKMGLVCVHSRKICNITNRLAFSWRTINIEPVMQVEDDRAVQVGFFAKADWERLKVFMEKKNYRYVGQGVWLKNE